MSTRRRKIARRTAQKRNRTSDDFRTSRREAIKRSILEEFYAIPARYWRDKLRAFCALNAEFHNSRASAGIYYENMYWHPESRTNQQEPDPSCFYLSIHPQFREEHEKDFLTCITMLGELLIERDTVHRFLSYGLAFNVPIQTFFEELGSDILTEHFQNHPHGKVESDVYDTNVLDSFRSFMEKHQFIVEVLADRQMENILLRDLTKDE